MLARLLNAIYILLCGTSEAPPPSPPPQKPQQYHQPQQQEQWQRPPVNKPHHPQQIQQEPQHQQYPYRPPHGGTHYNKDHNLVNQQDSYYVSLRGQANEAGDAMAKCFEESHHAYTRGDRALAKELSNKGKEHQMRMEELNKKASEWIFTENNMDSKPHEVDLHGLYVKEAIIYTERSLQQARTRGDQEIHLIVGKGLHSKNGAAKLKPAIEELMEKYKLSTQLDPNNTGVLIVKLDTSNDRGVGADELTRRIERSDDACIIM